LRRYATSWKVAGSNLNEVIDFVFKLPNLSGRTMALVFSQPLTELSTRTRRKIFLGSRARPVRKAAQLAAICELTV
jgi:hypothetical protein